jgi:hypothetical protein
MLVLSTPLLGRGGVVVRTSRSPQSCRRNASSSRSFDREQDHVIAKTGRHELEAPEPNHRGAWNRRNESGHLERNGKSLKNTQDPYLACQLSVFSPRGVTPTSKTSACSPFQMVMQGKTQRFILVRAREGPTSSGGGEFVLSCT